MSLAACSILAERVSSDSVRTRLLCFDDFPFFRVDSSYGLDDLPFFGFESSSGQFDGVRCILESSRCGDFLLGFFGRLSDDASGVLVLLLLSGDLASLFSGDLLRRLSALSRPIVNSEPATNKFHLPAIDE